MTLYPTLRVGKCPSCETIYRWEDREGLKLTDARCRECDTPLKRARPRSSCEVVEVEADWLRRETQW